MSKKVVKNERFFQISSGVVTLSHLIDLYGWQAVYEDIAAGVLVEVKQDSSRGV